MRSTEAQTQLSRIGPGFCMDDSDDFHTQSLRVTRANVPKLVCALECGAFWGDGHGSFKNSEAQVRFQTNYITTSGVVRVGHRYQYI